MRLPTDSFVANDPAFAAAVGEAPRLELVETDAHEGPVYVAAEDALCFTTVPRPSAVPGRGREVAIQAPDA